MRKRKRGRTLSRTRSQRIALMRTLFVSLILHRRIKTTLAKAKELRPFAEKLVTKAKKVKNGQSRHNVIRELKRELPIVAVDELLKMAEKMADRDGGYLRIIKVSFRRSDNAEMALVEWVDESIKVGKKKVKKEQKVGKKTTKKNRDEDKK